MQRRRSSKHRWLLALGTAATLAGCEGGQTGDNGSTGGDGDCKEIGRQSLSANEADDAGFPASRAIADLIAGRTDDGETVWLTAPTSLWVDVGATPPPDRSLQAQLFVATTSIEELMYECRTGQRSELEIGVELRLESAEPRDILTGRGSMVLSKASLPNDGASAIVGIDGFEPDRTCLLRSQAAGGSPLTCEYIWAASTCVRPTERSPTAAVLRTTSSMNDLIAQVNAASPLMLQCLNGQTVAAEFKLLVPDRSCVEGSSGWTPAVMSIAIDDLDLPAETRSARLSISSKAQCLQRGCGFSGLCLATVTEEEFDAGANCAAVTVHARSHDSSHLAIHVAIQVDDNERHLAELVVTGPLDNNDYAPHCRGWSEL